jgi:hypothetical protein
MSAREGHTPAHLPGRHSAPVRVHGHRSDVVVVAEEKALSVALLVVNDADRSGVVGDLAGRCVEEVGGGILRSCVCVYK